MSGRTDQPSSQPHLPATDGTAALPAPLTPLVGREREVDDVRRLLAAARLLTLTGAGGSGKTRLALEVARRSAADFAHGAAWVELAPLPDATHLGDHVAASLGVRHEGSGSVEDTLAAALATRTMLIVLDNCEHVVDAGARLVEMLLRRCPGLRILATSREPLGVGGERSWLVPVLSLPDADSGLTAETAARSAAVQLFVARAQDALPAFALTDANADAIAHICRRIDGLPLAIELAAARVRVLSVEQLAARLDDRFRLLTSGGRAVLPRHRTLREAIDWSYRLLEARERLLMDRLSAFAGEWPLEAAEAVCAGDGLESAEILDLLGALVDKSLVTMRESEGVAWYRLLETIRQYAAGRLAEHGADAAVHARHARFYAALVAGAEPDFVTSRRQHAVARVERQLDNVRAALHWTREHEHALHLRLAGMLVWLWYSLGLWAEGRRWLEQALALPASAAPPRDRAAALFGAGAFASLQADPVAARGWLEESLTIAREAGDERLAAYASNYLGMVHIQQGLAEGEPHALAALEWFRAAGDLYGHRLALLLISTLRLAQGDIPRAQEAAEEAVEVARAFGMDRELGIALQVLASAVLQRGDLDRAEALVHETIVSLRRDPQPLFMGRALDMLGLIACRRGDPLRGAQCFGAAAAEREFIGAERWRLDRERLAPPIDAARAALGGEAFEAAWADGARRRLALVADDAPGAGAASPGAAPAAAPAPPPATPRAEIALRVLALGPLEIRLGDTLLDAQAWRYAKPRELLLYLLTFEEGRTREQIGAVFWPDASAAQVKNNFHVTLHHLRKALGRADWIVFEDDRYRVDTRVGVELDVRIFERELAALLGRGAAAADPAARIEALGAALARFRGDFLEDVSVGDWHLETRDRVRRLWVEGMLALGDALMSSDRHAEAADVYRLLVVREELHEEGCRRLMTCLARAGERVPAMRAYERLATLLRADLDTTPEPATVALYDRLRSAQAI